MKKLGLAVAVSAALGVGAVHAYTVAVPDDGVLVPNVIHNGGADTTAIMLTNHAQRPVWVYWTFFDEDSVHLVDGQFRMTENDMQRVIWSEVSGVGLENQRGYLVFMVGASATDPTPGEGQDLISAAAFQADAFNNDAIFIPTFPINDADLEAGANLTTLDEDSLVSLASGAPARSTVDMRYEIPGDFESSVLLWSTGGLDDRFTVNMFDDNQNRQSVNFICEFDELCFVDPQDILGRPANFLSGYIRFVTAGTGVGDFVSYTAIRGTSFPATQTVLNPHYGAPTSPPPPPPPVL